MMEAVCPKISRENFLLKVSIFFGGGILSLVSFGFEDLFYPIIVFLAFSIFGFFFFTKRIALFDPFTLFSAYYATVIPTAIYLKLTNFRGNLFLNTASTADIEGLFNESLFLLLVGYVSALSGYLIFAKNKEVKIDFGDYLSKNVMKIIIAFFALVGVVNFAYNVWFFAGGSVVLYFTNVAARIYEFQEFGGTTLGYIFAYTSAYCWMYYVLRFHRGKFFFSLFLVFTILMKASTGRIFGTLTYVLSFFGIYYFVHYKTLSKQNVKFILVSGLLCFFAVIFYVVRLSSILYFNNVSDSDIFLQMLDLVDFQTLMHFLVDKGNVPNITVLMNIVDRWDADIGFLCGKSLFSWLAFFIPSGFMPENFQVSIMIKEVWYAEMQGGAIPPTGVGEMYANFGIAGPFLGMFFFGILAAKFHNSLYNNGNFWFLACYVQISLGFFFIFPKGEFDNFSPLFFMPIGMTFFAIKIVQAIINPSLMGQRGRRKLFRLIKEGKDFEDELQDSPGVIF